MIVGEECHGYSGYGRTVEEDCVHMGVSVGEVKMFCSVDYFVEEWFRVAQVPSRVALVLGDVVDADCGLDFYVKEVNDGVEKLDIIT